MREWVHASFAASILLLPAAPAGAQGLNVTGSWTIQMQAVLASRGSAVASNTCTFSGATNVSQTGSQFSGDISVNRTTGSGTCPPAMSASLSGDVKGNQVDMGAVMGGGSLGQASFTGTVVALKAGAASTMGGTFSVTSGPFTGTGGTWSAVQVAQVAAVPTLGARALVALTLLLIGTSIWLLRRRPAPDGR